MLKGRIIMYDHAKLTETFKEKGCELVTTREELEGSATKVPKVRFVVSCGHENEVFVNVFIHRGTGVLCKECLYDKMSKESKEKKNTSNHEFRGFVMLRSILEEAFDVVKLNEGCLADMAIRKKDIEEDEWLGIQLKTTSCDAYNVYSFELRKDYPNKFIVCIQLPKEMFWVLDGNEEYPKKLNITQHYSKYDKYAVKKTALVDYFGEHYDRYDPEFMEVLNMPIGACQQREQEYRRWREQHVPLEFNYEEEEGLVYDFTVGKHKFQEKVGTVLKGKSGYGFFIHKNAGKVDGKRKTQSYNTGDNDFYWLNCPDKKAFFVIPEYVLVMKGVITEERMEKSYVLTLNANYSENTNYWANNFKLSYEDLDLGKLTDILHGREVNFDFYDHFANRSSSNSVKVGQYDMQGNLISEFESMSEASRITGINNSVIAKVCDPKILRHKSAGGYVWKYIGENHVAKQNRSKKPLSEETKQKIREKHLQRAKKVLQYDFDNTLLKVFINVQEVFDTLNYGKGIIKQACQGARNHRAYNSIWRYEKNT